MAKKSNERKQKEDSRGNKKQTKSGIPNIIKNQMKNNAENSTSKLKEIHTNRINNISENLLELRNKLPRDFYIKVNFEENNFHSGKILFSSKNINLRYSSKNLWKEDLNMEILSGERILIKGKNGSGKSSLIKIIIGEENPISGNVFKAEFNHIYLDQEYSIIKTDLTVLEQVQNYNHKNLEESEIKNILYHFLFTKDMWNKSCLKLSGGEKIKLVFCCLFISDKSPDMIILDEPTNNLDIESLEIITSVIKNFKGTLLVVSHDEYFLNEIRINKIIEL